MSRSEAILVLSLGVLVLLVYLPSFPGEFHFDDFELMLDSPHVTAPSFSYRLFLDEYGGRPLTLWTFHWNYRLFGDSPWSYHALSQILHLVGVGLLYLWIRREAFDRAAALFASAVFALHPLQTQAINYVWSRSVLLMFCFGMASLLLVRRPWLSLLCFQLAIWSRADGLVFLVPLLAANGFVGRSGKRFSRGYTGFAPIVLAVVNLGAFALFMARAKPVEIGWTHPHVFGYWWSQTIAFWKYVALMFWPARLSIDHDFSLSALWSPLGALCAWLVLAYVVWKGRAGHPWIVRGFVWICLALAPAALLPNSDPFNESRAYPALAGFALVLGSVFQSALRRIPRFPVMAAASLLILAMVPAAAARNLVWRNDLALWQDAAGKSPRKARVQYNLGAAWARAGDIVKAERSFERALVLDPQDDFACAALGYCAETKRDWALALERYERAVALNARNRYADEGRRRVLRQVEAGSLKQRL